MLGLSQPDVRHPATGAQDETVTRGANRGMLSTWRLARSAQTKWSRRGQPAAGAAATGPYRPALSDSASILRWACASDVCACLPAANAPSSGGLGAREHCLPGGLCSAACCTASDSVGADGLPAPPLASATLFKVPFRRRVMAT